MNSRSWPKIELDGTPETSGIVLEVWDASGRLETSIEEWLRTGPGPSRSAKPISARFGPSGRALPLRCLVPLRYRNNALARLLIALHMMPDPWKLPR